MSECHIHSDIFFVLYFGTKYDKSSFNDHITDLRNMEKINIKPLGDRIVIKPAQVEAKTASGIIIPDTAKEKPQQGVVVAVPAENKETPITVKVDDKVLYGKYAGTEINIEGSDYLIMSEKDILAVI